MNALRRGRLRALALLLIVASLWLRALIPAGFMPNFPAGSGAGSGADNRAGTGSDHWLVLCSGHGALRLAATPAEPIDRQAESCAFAALAMPALPTLPGLPLPALPALATLATAEATRLPAMDPRALRPPVRAGPRIG